MPLEASAAQATEFILVPSVVGSATPSEEVSESNALPATQAAESDTPPATQAAEPAPTPVVPAPPEVNATQAIPHIPTPADVRARYDEMPSTASKSWFVVTRGRTPGVYATW